MSHFWLDQKFPESLEEWQKSPLVHPYTCPNRDDGTHITNDRDLGVLKVVGPNELECPTCDWKQTVKNDFLN